MAENAHVFTDANFQNEVLAADKPVVVDLWAEWCAPCRAIGPIIEGLAGELSDTIKIGKLDIQANPQTPSQINGGKEVGRIVGGGRSADDFKKEFSKAFGVTV